ncbi:MAG: saccharopine dehydrogenase C-terminal domain-containing protein [Candidatus Nanoarchaeia archaeon]|nr:saccharopine dehydrogenase C-terminal domain-containing protein [Candidatus Nanoarchaeia archaeon]
MTFNKNILILGYGAVSQCTLPLFLKHIGVNPEKVTIIDFEDKKEQIKPYTDKGIKFKQIKVTPKNLESVLSENAGRDGMVIDLAWNIGANDIIGCCLKNNMLYVNTSVELWDPNEPKTVFDKTLYIRHMNLIKLADGFPKDSATAVVEHGANPGLISHFTKKALLDISERLIYDKKISGESLEKIMDYRARLDFPHLAQELGVKVIHCSERDTQITNRPKEVDEFVNTWSIEGFREEGTTTAEMGWGTHEKEYPRLAHTAPYGPKNQIFLAQMGINTRIRSWVPEVGEIEGMIVRHGEAFTISDYLTVRDNEKVIYRPTVHYAYMPCHEAISSLAELRARNYEMQPKIRIMNDDIISGKDILGALLMGHAYNSWWTGSSLSIEETRRVRGAGQNATTLQVAAGVVSAAKWAIDNPKRGICVPEDLPHDYVLDIAKPYLGDLISIPYDWTPLKNKRLYFPENPDNKFDEDPWQFKNFRPFA